MKDKLILIGHRYNRWIVIEKGGLQTSPCGASKRLWLCECDCGNKLYVTGNSLRSGNSKSCGCLHSEIMVLRNLKHGLKHTQLYSVWVNMKTRCYNKNRVSYKNYGGRGIKVCAEWKENFSVFHLWANWNGWVKGLDIDRIDNDGDYKPSNCRFATREVNSNNTRRTLKVEYNGKIQSLKMWSKELGIKYSTLHGRYKKGWDINKCFSLINQHNKKELQCTEM